MQWTSRASEVKIIWLLSIMAVIFSDLLANKPPFLNSVNKNPLTWGSRANSEDRTRDLTITNRLLYQLSYVGAICGG